MRSRLFESCGHYFVEVPASFVESAGLGDAVGNGRAVSVAVDYDTQPRRFMALLRDADGRVGSSEGSTWCGLTDDEIERLHTEAGKRTTNTTPFRPPAADHDDPVFAKREETRLEDVADVDRDVEALFEEVRQEIEEQESIRDPV